MDEHTMDEGWDAVGRQFRALGESVAHAFRAAWENEENRQHLRDLQSGLESMANQVGQAVSAAAASPEGQKLRAEAEQAAVSAREAGKQALEDSRPYLLSALRQVNEELDKLIRRMEEK